MKQRIALTVNGDPVEVFVEPWKTLQQILHDELELTGTKEGCDTGHCGACTVIMDGKAVKSCLILAPLAKGRDVWTIESLANKERLHPLQEAFLDHYAVQCGFCTPGMIMAAKALLDENPNPTEEEVREGIHGVLCRCTGYVRIVEAILVAAKKIQKPLNRKEGTKNG
jgi:carbon-monoxide dehydrogenase small subunit